MKVRAIVSFGGQVGMYQGEERELEGSALRDLLAAGYVEQIEPPKPKRKEKAHETE